MAEATIGALANIITANASVQGVVAALTQANARLAKQLEDNSNELRELKALNPSIIAGRMANKLVALTRVSFVSSRNPATKRRQLERITWEVVKPTGNDITFEVCRTPPLLQPHET
jgi:hypothetical protein